MSRNPSEKAETFVLERRESGPRELARWRWPLLFLCILALNYLFSPGAQTQTLAPGITDLRPGLLAYTDLWHLCFWHDGLAAGQMSSRDPHGRNIDLGHFHGIYQGGLVLARLSGPGVVYRLWSAGPTGRLLFYVDGQTSPALACGFREYLEGECGAAREFALGRRANYTPVYFRDSLIITARGFRLEGAYYQVSYMTFASDPGLRSFSEAGPLEDMETLAVARRFWESSGREPGRELGGEPRTATVGFSLLPGESRTLEVEGAGLITELRLVEVADPLDPLSDIHIKIYWDGSEKAAVNSPADAFFGNRFDARRESRTTAQSGVPGYDTLTASATPAGYSCRWPMPFARGMKLLLTNQGSNPHRLRVEADYRQLSALPSQTMRFHALYHQTDYPDDELTRERVFGLSYVVDPSLNYVVLEREGRGYYVGCFLYVRNLGSDWWGEGDEMIWVDGDEEPLIVGTGTEDEFNWSFGLKENRSPLSGALRVTRRRSELPQDTPGYNALYRYRLGDFIPFHKSIKVTYERLGSTNEVLPRYPGSPINVSPFRGDDYQSVAFWYELGL